MRVRYLLIALAAGLLALGVWLLRPHDPQTEAARPRVAEISEAPSPVDTTPTLELEDVADVERSATSAESQLLLAPSVESTITPKSADVEGTLVLERTDGSRDAAPEAQFTLLAWTGEAGLPVEVDVHAGRWATRFPEAVDGRVARVEFESVRIGNRSAVVRVPSEAVAIPSDHAIEIVAYFPPATLLRVVDAGTGRDLGEVQLRWASGFSLEGAHPGLGVGPGQRILAEHKKSPIDVSDLEPDQEPGICNLRVHSPGYAWTQITFDTRTGGERVVQLERGGTLRLTLVDNSGSKAVQVCLRRASEGSVPVLSLNATGRSEFLLDGLATGAYSITAELGE